MKEEVVESRRKGERLSVVEGRREGITERKVILMEGRRERREQGGFQWVRMPAEMW